MVKVLLKLVMINVLHKLVMINVLPKLVSIIQTGNGERCYSNGNGNGIT